LTSYRKATVDSSNLAMNNQPIQSEIRQKLPADVLAQGVGRLNDE
jgi:hypothetical protein